MESFEAALPIPGDGLASRESQVWARRLVESLFGLALEQVIPSLRKAHRDLCIKKKIAAANAIATASNAILPAVFDRAEVRMLQARMFDPDFALVTLPVATRTMAEIMMAGAEGRQACYCQAADGNKAPVAAYALKIPPTTGIDPDWGNWIKNTEQFLADKFVDPEYDRFLDEELRREMIANQLGFEAEEQRTRYVVFQFKPDDDRNKAQNALMQLKQRFPALVLLDLSTEGPRIVQENKLFRPFEELLRTALETSP